MGIKAKNQNPEFHERMTVIGSKGCCWNNKAVRGGGKFKNLSKNVHLIGFVRVLSFGTKCKKVPKSSSSLKSVTHTCV